ncbi:MAG: hypothetical protein D3909_06700 [Candidatus Electrothrix sp. ATG1]|nr:hypothetical protein [Candidatus Electrothrix sp. ATG1]
MQKILDVIFVTALIIITIFILRSAIDNAKDHTVINVGTLTKENSGLNNVTVSLKKPTNQQM